jgi:hypothetical protein
LIAKLAGENFDALDDSSIERPEVRLVAGQQNFAPKMDRRGQYGAILFWKFRCNFGGERFADFGGELQLASSLA